MAAMFWWLVRFLFFHRCFHLLSAYSEKSYDFSLVEESPIGTLIGLVELDPASSYRLSLTNSYVKKLISLDFTTGEVRSTAKIDREKFFETGFQNEILHVTLVSPSASASIININIHVLDINDNAPEFTKSLIDVSIFEGASPGSRFPIPAAFDLDYGVNGTIAKYQLKSNDEDVQKKFRISRVTDVDGRDSVFLELVEQLDREHRDNYNFELEAIDGGTPELKNSVPVLVTVLDVNDNVPTFAQTVVKISINPINDIGNKIATAVATDADCGENANISYSLRDDINGQFSIDVKTGEIKTLKSPIKCEKDQCPLCLPTICVLSIEASDHGVPKLTGRAFFNVQLNEENLYAPMLFFKSLTKTHDYVLVEEHTKIGETVMVMIVTDDDRGKNGETTLSLESGNEEKTFQLESGNNFAVLRLNKKLNFEKRSAYSLEFVVADHGVPSKVTKNGLKVFVRSPNDKRPHFPTEKYFASIFESLPIRSAIMQVQTVPSNIEVNYRIVSTFMLPFEIHPRTGVIKLIAPLTHNTQKTYEFHVEAVNAPPFWKSASVRVVIVVIDSNNHAPVFENNQTLFDVIETHDLSKNILHAKCIDLDDGENGRVSYSVTGFNVDSLVRINPDNGKVYLNKVLEYQKMKNFTFGVTCEDNGIAVRKKTTQKFTFFVKNGNNRYPKFLQTFYFAIVRKSDPIGTVITSTHATDLDPFDDGNLFYYVVMGSFHEFNINHQTGQIFTIAPVVSSSKTIKIVVGAKDLAGHMSNKATILVYVVDELTEVPVFQNAQEVIQMNENTPAGQLVKTFTATVPSQTQITYQLLVGMDDLEINELTGELRTKTVIDREVVETIPFVILASTLEAVAQHSGKIIVNDLNDNAPTFVGKTNFTVDLTNYPIGAPFDVIKAVDADAGLNGMITYSCDSQLIAVDAETGVLLIRPSSANIDENQWQVKITASDKGLPVKTTETTITLHLIPQTKLTTIPSTISLFDVDKNSRETMNLLNDLNLIYEAASNVTFADYFADGRLLYDTVEYQPFHLAKFNVINPVKKSVHHTKLQVFPKKPTSRPLAPVCLISSQAYVEFQLETTVITQAKIINSDGAFIYRYKLLNETDWMQLDEYTGKIFVTKEPSHVNYIFDVNVSVFGFPHLSTKCQFKVEIIHYNARYNSKLSQLYYPVTLSENHDEVIGQAVGISAGFRYSYEIRNYNNDFSINLDDGTLKIKNPLVPGKLYNVSVVATANNESCYGFFLVKKEIGISLTPVLILPKIVHISENTVLGTVIATASTDFGNATVNYYIREGNLMSTFDIDPITGSISVIKMLDYEKIQNYSMKIVAFSGYHSVSTTIQVNIENELDNPPVVLTKQLTIAENNKPNYQVKLEIQDVEERPENQIELNILYQFPSSGNFRIVDDNKLVIGNVLDKEDVEKFELLIEAVDRKNPQSRSQQIVHVFVSDINDNIPICLDNGVFLIPKNAVYPVEFRVSCYDLDEGLNGSIWFKPMKFANGVDIDWSGKLTVSTKLNDDITELEAVAFDRMDKEAQNVNDGLRTSSKIKLILVRERPGQVFRNLSNAVSFYQGIKPGTVVTTLQVVKNALHNSRFFIRQNPAFIGIEQPLSLNDRTGEIRVIKTPLTNTSVMHLEVIGVDTVNHKTHLHKIAFEITDVRSDNQGYFIVCQKHFEFNVYENASRNDVIGNIVTCGGETNLQYTISNIDNNNLDIDKNTGKIIVHKPLDYENNTFYHFEVTISSSSMAVTVSVLVHVLNVNDNAPVFDQDPINFYIRENALSGEFVGQLIATDKDSTRIKYALESPPGLFLLDTVSGIVTVAGKIDHEKQAFYNVRARAIDSDGLETTANVFIFVEDENDNPPMFIESGEIVVTVSEHAPIGTFLHQFEVADDDDANNFNFEIDFASNGFDLFSIDDNGRLITKNFLNREHVAEHKLVVVLSDDFLPKPVHRVRKSITIVVTDVNDNAPVFVSSRSFSLLENTKVGTVIGNVEVTDADIDPTGLNSQVQFRLKSKPNSTEKFVIDPVFGYIILNEPVDREVQDTYNFTVIAEDNGTPRLFSEKFVVIYVLDDDDNRPVIVSDHSSPLLVSEFTEIGTNITHVVINDPDVSYNAITLFEIVSGNANGIFRIDRIGGQIFTTAAIDYETTQWHHLNVSATPFSGRYPPQYVSIDIRVVNENDEPPVFVDGAEMTLQIAEAIDMHYPAVYYRLNVLDGDENATNCAIFAMQNGNTSLFTVNATSGDLILQSPLDFESHQFHDVEVKVTDCGNTSLYSTILIHVEVIDVNDNAPLFVQPYYRVSVEENLSPGQTIVNVTANDADFGVNGRVFYSIVNSERVPFSIDFYTGEIVATEKLNYEAVQSYEIIVQASDEGNYVTRSSQIRVFVAVIDVNDNPPVIYLPQSDIHIRSDTKKGNVVYVVNIYDPDTNDDVDISLSGVDSHYFGINRRGVIRTKLILPQDSNFVVTITATDSANHSTSAQIQFYMAPASDFPIFKTMETRYQLNESDDFTFVTRFEAMSTKGVNCVRYSIAAGNSDNTFMLDSHSGVLSARLDYEKNRENHLYVAASDCHLPVHTSFQPIVIRVKEINDNAPIFTKEVYTFALNENQDPATESFGQVSASDADSGLNAELRYKIISGNTNNTFKLDSVSGSLFALKRLDREEYDYYELVISATDQGENPKSAITMVKITVLDENDNAPKFSRLLKAFVPEDTPIGTIIATVVASDADTEIFSNNTYSIEGDDAQFFEIDPISGNLTLVKALDTETKSTHKIKVNAHDGFWRVSATMTIVVTDVNDNAPVFENAVYDFYVTPGHNCSQIVGYIKATDIDEGINKQIVYFTNAEGLFVDPISGAVFITTTSSMVDLLRSGEVFASNKAYPTKIGKAILSVKVAGEDFSRRRTSCDVEVGVDNLDDLSIPIVRLLENSLRLNQEQFDRFTFLTKNTDIAIDPSAGVVRRTGKNKKPDDIVKFELEVNEKSIPGPQGIKNVRVCIFENINFHFKPANYDFTISKNSPVNMTIGYVTANSTFVYYSILNGDSVFNIDFQTGRLFVAKSFDYEGVSANAKRFFVVAQRDGLTSINERQEVSVTILNVNDDLPIFPKTKQTFYVSEPIPAGAHFGTVTAYNDDRFEHNEIVYSIGAKNEYIEIDSKTGELFALTNIDFAAFNSHDFTVIAKNVNSIVNATLNVKVELRISPQNTAAFSKSFVEFDISRRSKKTTIVGELESHSIFGTPHFHLISSSGFEITKMTGDIVLTDKLSSNSNTTLLAIVKSGKLNRKPPRVCRVSVVVNDLAPAPIFPETKYIVSLPSDAKISSEILRFNFALPSDVQMEVRGIGSDAFCFDRRGVLTLCQKMTRESFNLVMVITTNNVAKSKADLIVHTIPSKQLQISPENAIAYMPDKTNVKLHLLRIKPIGDNHDVDMVITDSFMREMFSLNSTTGILSTTSSFDREHPLLYKVPIKANTTKNTLETSVHVIFTDENDNPTSQNSINATVVTWETSFTGDILRVNPADQDDYGYQYCPPSTKGNIKIWNNCVLSLTDFPIGDTVVEMQTYENVPYNVRVKVQHVNKAVVPNSIIIKLFANERAVADFMGKLQDSIPDMEIFFFGYQKVSPTEFELYLAISTADGSVLPPRETVRILDNFVAKKSRHLSVDNYASFVSPCSPNQCGNEVCSYSMNVVTNSTTFRNSARSWLLYYMYPVVKCGDEKGFNAKTINGKEFQCHNHACVHGKCIENNTCLCDTGYFGVECNKKLYSLGQQSRLVSNYKNQVTKIATQILTKEPHGLVMFAKSSRTDSFLIIDFINGKVRVTTKYHDFFNATVLQESINDGHWHKISLVIRNSGTMTVTVEHCDTDSCNACKSDNCRASLPAVHIDMSINFGALDLNDMSYLRAADVSVTYLNACLRHVQINNDATVTFDEINLLTECPMLMPNNLCESSEAQSSCLKGTCVVGWDDYKCICEDGYESAHCNIDENTVTLHNGKLNLRISNFLQHQLLVAHSKNPKIGRFGDSTDLINTEETVQLVPCEVEEHGSIEENSNGKNLDGRAMHWLEVDIRTSDSNAHILTLDYGKQRTSLRIVNGNIHYGSYVFDTLILEVIAEHFVSDGQWHRIGVEIGIGGKPIRLNIDNNGKEIESTISFPLILHRDVKNIHIGAINDLEYHGCLRRLLINNQEQNLNPKTRSLPKQYFMTSAEGPKESISSGCGAKLQCDDNSIDFNCKLSFVSQNASLFIIMGATAAILAILAGIVWFITNNVRFVRSKSENSHHKNVFQ